MAGGQSQRRSSSVKTGHKTALSSSKAEKHGKNPRGGPGPVLTATAPSKAIRSLPTDLCHQQQLLVANKVFFCFESEFTTPEVCSWLRDYNKEFGAHLSLYNELPNAMFMIQFAEVDWAKAKRALIDASPYGSVRFMYLLMIFAFNSIHAMILTSNI